MIDWYKVRKLFLFIPDFVESRLAPVKYSKRKGVNIEGEVFFYGKPHLGSEPWCITLGDNVHIADNVQFITHDGGVLILRKYTPDLEITKRIIVGNNVYIGVNAILLPGVKIGNNCVVAAGSIVSKNIADNSVIGGVPAKFIKSIDDYYKKAKKESLHLGDLTKIKKEKELKKFFREVENEK